MNIEVFRLKCMAGKEGKRIKWGAVPSFFGFHTVRGSRTVFALAKNGRKFRCFYGKSPFEALSRCKSALEAKP